jgi:hypothetical protein
MTFLIRSSSIMRPSQFVDGIFSIGPGSKLRVVAREIASSAAWLVERHCICFHMDVNGGLVMPCTSPANRRKKVSESCMYFGEFVRMQNGLRLFKKDTY